MPYPPPVPPSNRTNATVSADSHPADHNAISDALTGIINELGANPSGSQPTVQTRLDLIQGKIDFAWVAGSIGAQTTLGVYDLLSVDQGLTKPYPCRVFVQAVFTFGFGGGAAPTRCGFDIFRFIDNGTNNNLGANYQAPNATWASVSENWGWVVPAGQQYGFKVRSNYADSGVPGGNCWMGASCIYWIVNDSVI